ncbi:hypothetical protein [Aliarcobacter butzleri]|uniref:hypothetical protein n=1 Tax=Aliarcobacter butzleri TaxID=28197 RepID=UPI0021B28586|nr:hypothetical protein [Aliarcobacter butzleri]MCT7646753.1 hypothetical protein [Aliarcobacter butzleri]
MCNDPINFFMFTYDEAKPFRFQPCWYGKLEKDFFKQTHNKVDAIERVDDLIVLEEFHNIFTAVEYDKLIRLFKNEAAFIDYLKITEGYLVEKGNRKFDAIFKSNKKSVLRKFRAFNGKDKVYFSMDYILYKVDEQSKVFEEFINGRFLKGSTNISAEILNYFRLTVNDKLFVWNILGVTEKDFKSNKYSKEEKAKLISEKKKIEEALEKDDLSYIQNLLKERLVIWFKFFFARVILQRYCNIPAGLLVVKFEDYSSRMITECYLDKKLINIGRQQNDGSSTSFKGDGLVNLFLFVWNTYLYGRKVKVMNDIEFNINTVSDTVSLFDEEVLNIVKNMENEIKEHEKIIKNK